MIGMFTAAENRERMARLEEAAAEARKRGDYDEAAECAVAAEELAAWLRDLARIEG